MKPKGDGTTKEVKELFKLIDELTKGRRGGSVLLLRRRLSEIEAQRTKLHVEAEAIGEELRRREQIDDLKTRVKALTKDEPPSPGRRCHPPKLHLV